MTAWVLILFFAAKSGGATSLSVDMASKMACELARMRVEQQVLDGLPERRAGEMPVAVCVERQ